MNEACMPTNEMTDEQRAYRVARHKVRRLRGWYLHAMVYLAVNGAFWLVFLANGAESLTRHGWPRPLPMTLGWGLGLLIHGALVWSSTSGFGRQWESRKVDEFMRDERSRRKP